MARCVFHPVSQVGPDRQRRARTHLQVLEIQLVPPDLPQVASAVAVLFVGARLMGCPDNTDDRGHSRTYGPDE